jgi:hypothetical protein
MFDWLDEAQSLSPKLDEGLHGSRLEIKILYHVSIHQWHMTVRIYGEFIYAPRSTRGA